MIWLLLTNNRKVDQSAVKNDGIFGSYLGVKMKLPIYLDYAATCPVDERVAKK